MKCPKCKIGQLVTINYNPETGDYDTVECDSCGYECG